MDKWWDHGDGEGKVGDKDQIIYPYLTKPMKFCIAGVNDNSDTSEQEKR